MELSTAAKTAVPSGVRLMFEKVKAHSDSIDLTLGEPGFITPKHVIDEGVKHLLAGNTKYTPNAGVKELRDAIAEKLWVENKIKCDPDKNLIVTAGATQALMLAMVALVNPGDEVILQTPNWPDYKGQIDMVNATAVWCNVDEKNGFKMTADLIEPLITEKTKLIIVNSPSNPTGGVLNYEDMKAIAELVKKYKVFVISDEPYEKFIYDGERHVSLGEFDGLEDYLLTINSFSKTYAMTGWRVGYICANEYIMKNLIKLHENMIASINGALQLAAISALKNGEEDIKMMLEAYRKNRDTLIERINKIKGFSCPAPHGAFYAFANVKDFGLPSAEVANLIFDKTHVAIAPGDAFGPGGEGFVRICYAQSHEKIVEAMDRLEAAFGLK